MRSNEGPTSHGHQSQHRDPCPIPPPLHSLEHGRLRLSDTGFRSSSPNYARGRCAERWWHPKRRTNRQTGADACNEERRNAHGHTHQETCLRCRLCICSPAPPARAQRTFVCEVGRSSSPSVSMTPDSRVGHIDLRFGRLTGFTGAGMLFRDDFQQRNTPRYNRHRRRATPINCDGY